jgi:hypothetical protein
LKIISETCTIKTKYKSRITAVAMKFMRQAAKYGKNYKRNQDIVRTKIKYALTQILEY